MPHSREYERAEDAPAVRAELAKRLTRATIGCIAAGVAASFRAAGRAGSTAPKQPTPEPPAQEEYYPDEEPAPARQPAAKKHGFFGGLDVYKRQALRFV